MPDHDTHDHTGVPGAGTPTEILDIPTAETDDTLVLAPDGAGGVEFRAEAGGGGGDGSSGARMFKQQNMTAWGSSNNPGFTWPATPTNGNRLYVVVAAEGVIRATAITQTNVTWTRLIESTAGSSPAVSIWEGVVAASAGTSMAITMTGGDYCCSWGAEFSGLSGTLEDSDSKTAVSVANGGDASPIITPTSAAALVIGVICSSGYGAGFATSYSGQIGQAYPCPQSSGILPVMWGFPGKQESWMRAYNGNLGTSGNRSSAIVAVS